MAWRLIGAGQFRPYSACTVNKREDIEFALAQAEAAREVLEVAFAEATAALLNTVTDAAKIDANQAEASAKVEKARARCRQLRAALAEPNHVDFITRSRERLNALAKQIVTLPHALETLANSPSEQSGEHAVRGENEKSQDRSRRRSPIYRFKSSLATSPHVRETIGLLALVLAYLQYYYFDVQLQILRLPSIAFALPLQ